MHLSDLREMIGYADEHRVKQNFPYVAGGDLIMAVLEENLTEKVNQNSRTSFRI